EEVREVGARIQRTTRGSDLVAYAGRNRFVLLLIGSNLQGARIAADRLEAALAGTVEGPLSIGLAAFDPSMSDPSELLAAADQALLAAEAAGGGVELALP
ncbi:MAG TPA: diguanylate cyclase, partial [Longimicrobiales bacterium]|nr:diguanylate cyclase [Longimicrobiales bacterium]